jgi:Tol biopolymer transport system component/predicted Ser/Thr protein kinase
VIGKTISHYRILEKLGEGGMGVVYKAHDTTLDRLVALKFLPHYLTSDPAEKERFYHEARAASALLHGNVAVVFEINEQDGQVFIAMEYVEGRTLKQMIQEEPLALKTVLDIAVQVCDGLVAAHERGIVHRDIKSENIMVTPKGQPKITDFGLAKVKGATKLTKTGSTVGTAAYMSPEQARGEEVDHRSDLFSFGVVVYEMLTGRLPFKGEHHAALLYSIMNDEPPPIARFNEKATPEIERIVAKALEKDRDDRYQHADEMLADLRRERKKLDYVKTGQVTARAEPVVKARRASRRRWYVLGAAAALVIVIAASYMLVSKRAPRVELNPNMTFHALPIPFTEVGVPGLSRDGAWAAFPAPDERGKYDVYFMNTASGASRRITADSSVYMGGADISPDGSQVAYDRWSPSNRFPEIAIVSSVGGSSRVIAEDGYGLSWRPDGQRIGYLSDKDTGSKSGKAEFHTVRPNGTDDRRELIDSSSTVANGFSWSPDGRSICWIKYSSEKCQELVVYDLSTGRSRQITHDRKSIYDMCWAPNGHIIFSSDKTGNFNLWMIPASGGAETQITKGAGPDYQVSISGDGSKLLYRQMQVLSHIWIAGTDGKNARQITFDDVRLWRVAFTPDAKKVLFGLVQPGALEKGAVVCSVDRDGRNRTQLTSGEESINNPLPSPDGRWIIYGRSSLEEPSDSSKVYIMSMSSPSTRKLIGRGSPARWIDDKRFLAWDFITTCNLLYSIEGGEPTRFFEDSTHAMPLQGGRYIGYWDIRSGREGFWVCAAPGVRDSDLPSPKRIADLLWAELDKAGTYLYSVKSNGEFQRISIPSGKKETIRRVFPGLSLQYSWWDISYDGTEIVYTDARPNCKLIMIENVFK